MFLKAKTLETGLSDFHNMAISVFKQALKKPKIVTNRDYKRFNNEKFSESLVTYFITAKNISHSTFEILVLHT